MTSFFAYGPVSREGEMERDLASQYVSQLWELMEVRSESNPMTLAVQLSGSISPENALIGSCCINVRGR